MYANRTKRTTEWEWSDEKVLQICFRTVVVNRWLVGELALAAVPFSFAIDSLTRSSIARYHLTANSMRVSVIWLIFNPRTDETKYKKRIKLKPCDSPSTTTSHRPHIRTRVVHRKRRMNVMKDNVKKLYHENREMATTQKTTMHQIIIFNNTKKKCWRENKTIKVHFHFANEYGKKCDRKIRWKSVTTSTCSLLLSRCNFVVCSRCSQPIHNSSTSTRTVKRTEQWMLAIMSTMWWCSSHTPNRGAAHVAVGCSRQDSGHWTIFLVFRCSHAVWRSVQILWHFSMHFELFLERNWPFERKSDAEMESLSFPFAFSMFFFYYSLAICWRRNRRKLVSRNFSFISYVLRSFYGFPFADCIRKYIYIN